MPNLSTHIYIALKASERLDNPTLTSNLGYCLLGATTPDIRAMTKKTRQDYHFVPLDFDQVGDGVKGLFKSQPHLNGTLGRDTATKSFMVGYITHLLLDERWIVDMYRPYFGNRSVFSCVPQGKIMDRVMQLELDRQAQPVIPNCAAQIEKATGNVDIRFIPDDTIAEWRNWVVDFVRNGFTWDRLRFLARRVSEGEENHPAQAHAERFLSEMPNSLEHLFEKIPRRRLQGFQEDALDTIVEVVGGYLS